MPGVDEGTLSERRKRLYEELKGPIQSLCKRMKNHLASSCGSRDAGPFDFFFHDAFMAYPMEFENVGVAIPRAVWAKICLLYDPQNANIIMDLLSSAVDKFHPNETRKAFFLENAEKWLKERKYSPKFDPWSFTCMWDPRQEEVIAQNQNLCPINEEEYASTLADEYPQLGEIRNLRKQNYAWADIRRIRVENITPMLPVYSRAILERDIRYFTLVEEYKAMIPGEMIDFNDINRILASHVENSQPGEGVSSDIFWFGIRSISQKRMDCALQERSKKDIGFRIFKKWFRSRYLYDEKSIFTSFQNVCYAEQLAVLNLTQFAWNVKNADPEITSFDPNAQSWQEHNTLPALVDIIEISNFITEQSNKMQEEVDEFYRRADSPLLFDEDLFQDMLSDVKSDLKNALIVSSTSDNITDASSSSSSEPVSSCSSSSSAIQCHPNGQPSQLIPNPEPSQLIPNAEPQQIMLPVQFIYIIEPAPRPPANNNVLFVNAQPENQFCSDHARPKIGSVPITDSKWAQVKRIFEETDGDTNTKAKKATKKLFGLVISENERTGTLNGVRGHEQDPKMENILDAMVYLLREVGVADPLEESVLKEIKAAISEKTYSQKNKNK